MKRKNIQATIATVILNEVNYVINANDAKNVIVVNGVIKQKVISMRDGVITVTNQNADSVKTNQNGTEGT